MVDVRETFYGRHTAQHQLQWMQIKNQGISAINPNDSSHDSNGEQRQAVAERLSVFGLEVRLLVCLNITNQVIHIQIVLFSYISLDFSS